MNEDELGGSEARVSGMRAVFSPLVNAVVAPTRCWQMLDARPLLAVWIVLWLGVFSTAFAMLNMPIMRAGMQEMFRAQMRQQGQEVSAEQLETMMWWTDFSLKAASYGTTLFVLINVSAMALLIWFGAALMGGNTKFSRSFAVASGAAVVHPGLATAYATLVIHLDPPEIRRPEDFVRMMPSAGVDLLFPGIDLPVWLNAMLLRIDLFNIWWIVLVTSGSVTLLRLSRGQGIALGVLIWAIFTGWNVLWAALGLSGAVA